MELLEKLTISNFGPVQYMDVEIHPVTILIGTQGSGKSTVAKLLTICRDLNWYIQIIDSTAEIIEPFKKFCIEEYFKEDTYLHYQNIYEDIEIEYKDGAFTFRIDNKDKVEARNLCKRMILEANTDFFARMGVIDLNHPDIEKKYGHLMQANARTVLYVPAERNVAGMMSSSLASIIAAKVPIYDALIEYIGIYERAKSELKEYYLPFLDVTFAMNNGIEKVYLGKGGDKHAPLPFKACSSGLQSVVPLLMSIDYALSTSSFNNFAIEEPEQNLFPSNQRELLNRLMYLYNTRDVYGLLLTTHSPYTLSCMNVYMMAGKLLQKDSENRKKVLDIVGDNHYISPLQVSAYRLDPSSDNFCENLIDPKTGLIGMNSLDAVSEVIGSDYDRLFDLYINDLRSK